MEVRESASAGETHRRWFVDSVEEGVVAVLEDGFGLRHLPLWLFPTGVREGDVLTVVGSTGEGEAVFRLCIDRGAGEGAISRARERLARLRGSDSGGEIDL